MALPIDIFSAKNGLCSKHMSAMTPLGDEVPHSLYVTLSSQGFEVRFPSRLSVAIAVGDITYGNLWQ